ncbi:XRE family transcriptional regulator [Amycolatopsis balhimycina DSM 5908]|uniref:XRE family transcriptional regulator n=1 Tax=Amycolatopsis balhimycina DSM 5908 TaxID=1081091 RepID=A0A428VXG3_AMYBA|nr:helix-turn-helix transcriptional regulator [Amycolatopsis balhimycina]RSM35511.1 XRE family transcriptional regulator [Amycolatopsis balhimycina DSM 5908]
MATPFATPRARALGFGLRRCREARDFGVRQLARLIGVHAQELSNWEYGKRIPKVEQVALLMGVLVVEPAERKRLLELARSAHEPSWLEKMVPGVAPSVSNYAEHERAATAIFDWEPTVIPGLLQTPDYVRALLAGRGSPPERIEQVVQSRLARRQVLTGYDPLDYHVLVGEIAVRAEVGSAQVMTEQLQHLLKAAVRGNIRLQVMPVQFKPSEGPFHNFALLDYYALPSIVFVELHHASAYLYDEDQVASYRAAAKTMAASAMDERESARFIGEVIAELGGSDG